MSAYSSLSFMSQGDVAVTYEISKAAAIDMSEIKIKVYGGAYPKVDIAFEYRLSEFENWRSDSVISAGPGSIDGNVLKGVDCSIAGHNHIAYWNHKANGLVNGQECMSRMIVLPSPVVFLTSGTTTWAERVSTHDPYASLNRLIVNTDKSGNFICITDLSVDIVDINDQTLLSISASSPSFALQKPDGNYLILEAGSNTIVETDRDGNFERSMDASVYVSSPNYMSYDDMTENLLISGGLIHKVYEFSWGNDYGDLLWEHGHLSAGSGSDYLDSPHGVAYSDDRSIVYISDYGNGRLVKIDRKTGDITTSESVDIGDVSLTPNLPKFIHAVGDDSVIICEGQGEPEYYSAQVDSHPSLKRYKNKTPSKLVDKDNLQEYNNLLFTPLLHSLCPVNETFFEFSSSESTQSSTSESSTRSSESSSS